MDIDDYDIHSSLVEKFITKCDKNAFRKMLNMNLNSISAKYKQSQIQKNILIISDMAFDAHPSRYYWARGKDNDSPFNYNNTLFEKIQKEYAIYGYKLPKLIFWNVNARGTTTIPVQDNELGMSLVSGFSANMFKMVMSEELDPYEQLLCILNSERYKPVEQALQA